MLAIIFDLDNTLIDFIRRKHVSCEAAVDAMIAAGLKVRRNKALAELYTIYYEIGLEDRQIFQKWLKHITGKVDYRLLAYGINAYRRARRTRPYPGTKQTLRKLRSKGYKLGIVTDAPKLKAWLRLTDMGIDQYFDAVITFDDTKHAKPSAIPFKKIMRELSVRAEDCLMVGDHPHKDIAGAAKTGMKTCFAKYGYIKRHADGLRSMKPDMTIRSIEELKVI